MKKLYSAKTNNLKSILQLVLVMVVALSTSLHTYAQVRVDFTPRSSVFTPDKTIYNIKGDFTMLGNTNLTLVNYDNNGNNSSAMKYVDIDNDPNTFNSSAATLTFSDEFGANPDCSNIVYAGLYWTGRSRADNTFSVTKDVSTGNSITQQVTSSEVIYDGDAIPNTNYFLTRSVSGSVTTFRFTSSGSGDTVEFFYNTSFSAANRYLKVSVNGGAQTDVPTSSLSNFNAYLDVPYTVFSNSDYTLNLNRLRLLGSNRAYVDVTFNETIPEVVQVSKTFDKRKISIKGPNATSYTQLTANADDIYYPSGIDGDMYSAYVDVTDYVRNNGKDGLYHVADIALVEGEGGSTGYYGGWGMVVVYENSQMKWKDITVFDGHAYVEGSTTVNHTLDVSGFNSAQNGPVNLKLGVMAGEGDRNISGDYFMIQRQSDNAFEPLSHNGNSITNFFNSSIQTGGTRNPSLLNNTGLDISMFDLDNSNNAIIDNNQTSTRFEYGTTQDTYIIFNITFSVDAYIPESEGLLSIQNIAGNTVNAPYVALPGDEIEYGLEIRNKGTEAIKDAKLVLPIPFTSEFVPGSITFNEYDNLFNATAPYFDPSEGATGSIVWDIAYLPLDTDLTKLLADIRFRLKTTEDCSILINNDCAPKIVILGGYIAGTGDTSNVEYSLPLIQGYQEDGVCEGEPNTDPIQVDINSEQYIIDNCTGVSIEREFLYCNFDSNGIPVSEIQAQFPQGSLFYDSYPVTDGSIQYDASNPFPATIGKVTYYAVPPGSATCSYIFTIEVTDITSSPSVSDVDYCLDETADPLTAQASDPNYTLFYYADNNPTTVGQSTLVPDTSVAGEFTYYVAEGTSADCVNTTRTPITVTVYEGPTITLEEQTNNTCANSNSGSIDISISGGSGNYTFDWEYNGLQDPDTDTEALTNLADGTYTVIVTDADTDCTATASFIIITENTDAIEITAPEAITVSGCTTDDITNGDLTSLAYSESLVTIGTAEFLTEGGTFSGDSITNVTYIDSSTGECPIIVTRTFSVTDACDQTASSTQIITIENDVPPTLVIPQDEIVECGDLTDPSATGTAIVSDSCGNVEITFSDVITPGACEGEYAINRTWTATDTCGNVATAVQTISVQDTIAPVFAALPADSTIECSVTPEFAQAVATDACDSDLTLTFEDITTPGTCEGEFAITRTWTATDACGNSATASQTINMVDTVAPILSVPVDATVECSESTDPSATGDATATDACGAATITYTDSFEEGCGNTQVITRTWTATDDCGNTTSDTQTINVVDTTPPVLTIPADVTLECSGLSRLIGEATATDTCGTTVVTFEDNVVEGCGLTQVISRTWTATDECGNSVSEVQTISIVDTTAPTITLPEDIVVECSEPTDPSATGYATGEDMCGSVQVTFDDVVAPGACDGEYSISRTWTVTDECGNTTTDTQTIFVVDNTAPVIENPATDIIVECDGTGNSNNIEAWLNSNGGATASDSCSTNLTWSNNYNGATSDCSAPIEVIFTVSDGCGNSTSTTATYAIQDVVAPVITPATNLTVECDGQGNMTDLENWLNGNAGATASDNCSIVTWSNDFNGLSDDCGATGSATVTFTATDSCGNESSTTAIFTIADTIAPVIDTLPAETTIDCSVAVEFAQATASDACSGDDITFTFEDVTTAGTCEGAYSITRTWTATDACGNASTASQTINVQDITAPVIAALPAETTIDCSVTPEFSQAVASDACGSDVTLTFNDVTTPGTCEGEYSITRTWTATDTCGNASTASQTINVKDITAPVFAELPAETTVDCSVTPEFAQATATDACSTEVTLTFEDVSTPGTCEGDYSITRTWTATDACGNVSNASQTIHVKDITAPNLVNEYESEISITCDNIPPVPELVFEDACSDDIQVNFNETSTASEDSLQYVITRTWTVSDLCNNEAVYTQTINVDNTVNIIVATGTELCNGDDLNFNLFDLLSGSYDTNGTWSVVTGTASLDGSIFNPYGLELGTYTFMYATDDEYCPTETLVDITLNDDCVVLPCGADDVIISKAVTTYADGKNDFFAITGVEGCNFTVEVQIFNRWGAMVYESNDYQNDWNGTSSKASIGSSNYVPTGTYYYVVNLKNSGLKPFAGPIYVATK
ncbi:HYR-like domain-containing protein [Gelidibacter maritimus]|uniref:Gliding motility-associated C-terminal domain-containing protein n=1 Tax=Gelidibacter maritimus TaxID=2761487 RepID=A0A7W2R393_9FLAO|nr:gliding motility-associated C-terminal domain-containing protein [Gelidibacter maritimus]MBA6152592.1 gliding motility-associated C-terminal domain-containing protein [Gelidibacter maritimus]